MSRHNSSRQGRRSATVRGYSVEALRVVHVPVRGVLLWAGSASSPRFQHVDGGGDSGRGGGVAGVEIKQEWGKAPGVNSNQHSTENVRRK